MSEKIVFGQIRRCRPAGRYRGVFRGAGCTWEVTAEMSEKILMVLGPKRPVAEEDVRRIQIMGGSRNVYVDWLMACTTVEHSPNWDVESIDGQEDLTEKGG